VLIDEERQLLRTVAPVRRSELPVPGSARVFRVRVEDGTAPTPVRSSNNDRHRLSSAGNRQLNAAIHRIALTQARSHHSARRSDDSPTSCSERCSPTPPKLKNTPPHVLLHIGERGHCPGVSLSAASDRLPSRLLPLLLAAQLVYDRPMAFWRRTQPPNEIAEARPPDPPAMSDQLVDFVRAVHTVESTDDPAYTEAVETLGSDGVARVAEIEDLWQREAVGAAGLRQSLVMAAETIRDPTAVEFLRRVAVEWDPPMDAGAGLSCQASRAPVEIEGIRAQAVQALQTLAGADVDGAVESIGECVAAGSRTVKAIGIVALRELDPDTDRYRAAVASLPDGYEDLADLIRKDVRDVPQVASPEANLSGHRKASHPQPALDSNVPWPRSEDGSTPTVEVGDG